MSGMVDCLFDAWDRFEAHEATQRPVPAREVSIREMRKWVEVSLADRKRRSERQLAKSWKRTTPEKAARSVIVGQALIELLKQMEAADGRVL